MKTFAHFFPSCLAAVFLLAAGCGQPAAKLPPATPENAAEARNQMTAARGQIKSVSAPYLQAMMRNADALEKSGNDAMAAKNYAKAIASFTAARQSYQQALAIETGMAATREAAVAAKNEAEAARSAALEGFKTEARPEPFVAAEKTQKEADEALAKEDFQKARDLLTRAAAGYKAARAEAEKLMREELSRAAIAARKNVEAARAAASAVCKSGARPESFAAAEKSEKEAGEALAKEEFGKARDLFVRAMESYKIAEADGNKLNRDELSRAAYAKKKEAETERLSAEAASKPDTRPASFVAASNCMTEGDAALTKEEFARARELFTRAAEGFKAAVGDADHGVRAEAARAAWTKQLAEVDAGILERQAAADFAKLKSQGDLATGLVATNPKRSADEFTAATAALKDLYAKARTKENLPKAAPVVSRFEGALLTASWLQAHRTLGELEQLIPDDPRMADFREKAAKVPWPKDLSLDLGGGVVFNFVFIKPGTFTMGEGNEKHPVTLTKPFFMGKYEVTQRQWQAVMGNNPSLVQSAQNPVENICWNDAQTFVTKLNEKVPGLKAGLPTEAQWEYACRAGTTTKYHFGDDKAHLKEHAVYPHLGATSNFAPQAVGSKKPNAWGLYDMHGNVAEFCSDRFGPYPAGAQQDPQGAASGSYYVLRGGSSRDTPIFLTCAIRKDAMAGNVLGNTGLRLVLVTEAIAAYHATLKPVETAASATTASATMPAALPETFPGAPAAPTTNQPAAATTMPAAPATTTTATVSTPAAPAAPAGPVSPDDWMKGIPPRALPGFLQAQADAKAGKGMLAMRSWRAFWSSKLRDPTRSHVELEFAELLLSDNSKETNPALEAQKKLQNIKEAGIMIRTIRARNVQDPGLLNRLEETAKKIQ